MRKYRNYTDHDVITAASQSQSMSELLKALGLKAVGGNYNNMKRIIQKLNIDCSHWKTDNGWFNRGRQMKDWSQYSRSSRLKIHLIKLRTNCCENCKTSVWLEKPIKLEVHHLDGNRTNNNLDNLQLLCPNCHSFTKNFRNPQKGF
jgi:5-methylcytosine-specific restriction endonuclease McrA